MAEREAIFTQQKDLENHLAEINREFQAIDAHKAAKSGKMPRQAGSRSGAQTRQIRRGSRREELLIASRRARSAALTSTMTSLRISRDSHLSASVGNLRVSRRAALPLTAAIAGSSNRSPDSNPERSSGFCLLGVVRRLI